MKFSDTSNKNGIIQQCERTCRLGDSGISGNSKLLKWFTSMINEAGHEVWALIMKSCGGWQYLDSNSDSDDVQVAKNITSGTAKYAIAANELTIRQVAVQYESGGPLKDLIPITPERFESEIGISAQQAANQTGKPTHYILYANYIQLFPCPDYTLNAGLNVWVDLAQHDFVDTDTTAEPGFASPFHGTLYRRSSLEYLSVNEPDSKTIPILVGKINQDNLNIENHYADRFKQEEPKLWTRRVNWR